MKLLFFLRPTLIILILLILSIIINSTYAKTKVLYLSHVSVRGIRSATSTNPINGNVTIVSPTTNNTIDDLNVTAFVNTTVYDSERDTATLDSETEPVVDPWCVPNATMAATPQPPLGESSVAIARPKP